MLPSKMAKPRDSNGERPNTGDDIKVALRSLLNTQEALYLLGKSYTEATRLDSPKKALRADLKGKGKAAALSPNMKVDMKQHGCMGELFGPKEQDAYIKKGRLLTTEYL